MPHKTKKEKIIAEYRKRLKSLQLNQPEIPSSVLPSSKPKPIIDEKQTFIKTEDNSLIVFYFKSDFKKSLFLIATVIALEILLYFASINNYFKLGR